MASAHSPGPVADVEGLIRYWINPVHYDNDTGSLKPTAFDDASDKGLSVNRSKYMAVDKIREMAASRVTEWNQSNSSRPPRSLLGYSKFLASEIRKVVTSIPPAPDRRAFCVYDTAKPDDNSHADVCQVVSTKQGARSARSQMRELANRRLQYFA